MSNLQRAKALLAEATVALSAVDLKLAGVAPSERSTKDLQDKERLEAEVDQYQQKIERLENEQSAGDAPVRMYFVNRERELEQLFRPTSPQYVAVEAPAGYGKTALFRQLQMMHNRPKGGRALALYVEIPIETTAETAIDFVGPLELVVYSGALGAGKSLVDALVTTVTQSNKDQLILIFDNMERLATSAVISDLLWKKLVLALERRLQGLTELRAVFGGRRVHSAWQGSARHRLQYMVLEPFHGRAVMEAIQRYMNEVRHRPLAHERIDHITRQVLDLSGGHPRAIMGIVQEFSAMHFALDLDAGSDTYAFSEHELDRLLRAHVVPCLNEVFSGVRTAVADAMQRLSVLRGFNGNIIASLIDSNLLAWPRSPLELLAALSKETWLVSRPTQPSALYRDSIVRLMSASAMRTLYPDEYCEITKFAFKMYSGWVGGISSDGETLVFKPTDHVQAVFALEALYHLVDIARMGGTDHETLVGDLVALTEELTSQFVSTYEDIREVLAVFYESLRADDEFWALLHRVAGEEAAERYDQAVLGGN